MALKKSFRLLLLEVALSAPLAAQAQTTYQEDIDGGTCIPSPPWNSANNTYTGLSYLHWLYGARGTAVCHLTMPGL